MKTYLIFCQNILDGMIAREWLPWMILHILQIIAVIRRLISNKICCMHKKNHSLRYQAANLVRIGSVRVIIFGLKMCRSRSKTPCFAGYELSLLLLRSHGYCIQWQKTRADIDFWRHFMVLKRCVLMPNSSKDIRFVMEVSGHRAPSQYKDRLSQVWVFPC